MSKALTTKEFIDKAKTVHGNKYDYSKTVYKKSIIPVIITCPIHGDFIQKPNYHLSGCGCPECGKITAKNARLLTKDKFIEACRCTHGDYYDYSLVDYNGIFEKIKIICPKHGVFEQTPSNHVNNGQGCPKCGNEHVALRRRKTVDVFISEAQNVHGNKYDYSKVDYKNSHTKVCITCPEHGDFWQAPSKHINGQDCPECAKSKIWDVRGRYTKEEFVKDATKIYGDLYDYSKVHKFPKLNAKETIICKQHGEFLKVVSKHLAGQGCPLCSKGKTSKEALLLEIIKRNFQNEIIISNYRNKSILKNNKSYDIFIPKYKIAIEYQGKQHFKPVKVFGGVENYINTTNRDKEKYTESMENNIDLIYFTFTKEYIPTDYFAKVYTNVDEIIDYIKSSINKRETGNIIST